MSSRMTTRAVVSNNINHSRGFNRKKIAMAIAIKVITACALKLTSFLKAVFKPSNAKEKLFAIFIQIYLPQLYREIVGLVKDVLGCYLT